MTFTKPCPPDPSWRAPSEIYEYESTFLGHVVKPSVDDWARQVEEWEAMCWPWVGPVRADGQAFLHVRGAKVPIHRFAWLLWRGPIPDGQVPRPTACGTKLCVAPHHLTLVHSRGLQKKLTPQLRRDIQALYYDEGGYSYAKLADMFGVNLSLIRRIVKERDA